MKPDPTTLIPSIIAEVNKGDVDLGGEHENCFFRHRADGWYVEIDYRCKGEWVYTCEDRWTPADTRIANAVCEVTDIRGTYEETDDEVIFGMEDVPQLKEEFENAILTLMNS